jgi:hypothetical protein
MNRAIGSSLLLVVVSIALGCATPIGVRPMDRRDVRRVLSADAVSAHKPSIASIHVLLRLGLADRMSAEPKAVLAELHTLTLDELPLDTQTASDGFFALAEYSYLHAFDLREACRRPSSTRDYRERRNRDADEPACEEARSYYVAAAVYAYAFAFPDDSRASPNALDPRLRSAVDLYNMAITSAVRQRPGEINPTGGTTSFHLGSLTLGFDPANLEYAGRKLGNFVPAAQVGVRGLRNRYRQAGVGAPFLANLIEEEGVVLSLRSARVAASLRVPVTVFIRFENLIEGLRSGEMHGRMEIYSENRTAEVEVGGQHFPLEYETSAALAYSLEYSRMWSFEIAGFRSGDALPVGDGLMMMEPYRPGKIPVVLVHGTASSPARWAEMLNEYQSDPVLSVKYQFWIFMYTTGNPILYSASLLRESLQHTLAEIDPQGKDLALRRMVVVGHSQGGLLTKLQVISSGTQFWDNGTDIPFDEIEVRPETRELLQKAVFFEPQPFVESVVFISTPHSGSFLAGRWMGRLASRLFQAPKVLMDLSRELSETGVLVAGQEVVKRAGSFFGRFREDEDAELQRKIASPSSSVDNMDPNQPFIRTLQSIPVASSVRAHSIIPVRGGAPPTGQNDGVVEYASAHISEAISEYVVYHSMHSTQSHPETIQELRRILLDHIEAR